MVRDGRHLEKTGMERLGYYCSLYLPHQVEGEKRIAIFGDSIPDAVWLPEKYKLSAILQLRLNRPPSSTQEAWTLYQ